MKKYDVAAAGCLPGWRVYQILLTDISLPRRKLQHDYILEVISVAVTTEAPPGELVLTIPFYTGEEASTRSKDEKTAPPGRGGGRGVAGSEQATCA